MTNERKITIWGKVDPDVKELVDKISDAQGLTVSEYIRNLITQDLDKRTFFTTKVKNEMKEK